MAILALVGCATHPLVRTDHDPAVDFSRYRSYAWQQDWAMRGVYPGVRITSYTVGTFVLDMFDARDMQAVWRGSAEGTVPDSPHKVTKAVQSAVTRMFEAFPPSAPPR